MLPSTEVFDLPECVKMDLELMDGLHDCHDTSDDFLLSENARLQQANDAYAAQVSALQADVSEWRTRCNQHEVTIGQLQHRLTDQQNNFDRKFAEFLRCANDYDQAKNKEVAELRFKVDHLQSALDALQGKYDALLSSSSTSSPKATHLMPPLSSVGMNSHCGSSSGLSASPPAYTDSALERTPSNTSHLSTDSTHDSDHECGGHQHQHHQDSAALMYSKSFTVEQLKNVRIRQKNIVYVVGLPVSLCNAKLLKSAKWFGKFGAISRICFNTSPKCVKANSVPTFITYATEEAALQAIEKMNLYCLADGTRLKTNYGRTKYCPMFCEQKKCLNDKCKYLHEWAKFDDIITEQEIIDFNAIRAGPPSNHHRN